MLWSNKTFYLIDENNLIQQGGPTGIGMRAAKRVAGRIAQNTEI